MSKTYNFSDIRRVVCWHASAQATLDYLQAHGVIPVAEFKTAKRVMRAYDDAAMARAKELRAQYDTKLRAKRAAHAQRIRGMKGKPKVAAAPSIEHETLSTLLKATNALLASMQALHTKLDALAAQHSSPDFDDEPTAGGTA